MHRLFNQRLSLLAIVLCVAPGCQQSAAQIDPDVEGESSDVVETVEISEVAAPAESVQIVLAGGCFWCTEVVFEQLRGVTDVVSGYAGGSKEDADYQRVSAGLTRHAEAIQITYNPAEISLETLLKVFFFAAHDPTQVNRQYPDVGRQYRSAIFYADDDQKQLAAEMIDQLNESGKFEKKIATTLEPLDQFYLAEDYHQDYVKHNPNQPYVVAHSLPKSAKVRKLFPELIRK